MGLFSSTFESCAVCEKEIKINFFFSNGYKLLDNNFICVDCAEQYGVVPPLIDNNITSADLRKRQESCALIKNGGFQPTQSITKNYLYSYPFGSRTELLVLQLDETNGLINLPILIYGLIKHYQVDNVRPINKILNFELVEDGNSVTDGDSIVRSGVGHVLFGGVGAIVGAGTNAKATSKLCKSLKIKVTFDDIIDPIAYIDLLGRQPGAGVKTDSAVYNNAFSIAQKCMSILCILKERNSKKENANHEADAKKLSVADEILKFKQLLDMEAITQEEFDVKKKELLSL